MRKNKFDIHTIQLKQFSKTKKYYDEDDSYDDEYDDIDEESQEDYCDSCWWPSDE